MKLSKQATKGHLIVGTLLVSLSLGCFIATYFFHQRNFSFLVFFFGVWGGVELGRYLEYTLQSK